MPERRQKGGQGNPKGCQGNPEPQKRPRGATLIDFMQDHLYEGGGGETATMQVAGGLHGRGGGGADAMQVQVESLLFNTFSEANSAR